MIILDIELNGIENAEVAKVIREGKYSTEKLKGFCLYHSATELEFKTAQEQMLFSQYDKHRFSLLH